MKYLNLDYNSNIGIYVEKVSENSPADKEILSGDIVTMIDDYELSSMQELSEYLYTKNVGDTVKLQGIRGTKQFEVECILKRKIK